jgi:DNA repair exonuclease SbcCD ATPase subunit
MIEKKASLTEVINNLAKEERIFRDIRRLEEEIKELNNSKRIWTMLRDYVFADSMFPRSLLKRIVEELLTAEVNNMLSYIFPNAYIRFNVSGEGKGVSLDIYIDNIKRNRLTLSGGEKTLIGFAIRLGISRLVSILHTKGTTPDFLIIDEGFGPLDEENKSLIAEVLGTLVSTALYSQVIVISHESELKNHPVFRHIIEVRRDRGYSRVILRK